MVGLGNNPPPGSELIDRNLPNRVMNDLKLGASLEVARKFGQFLFRQFSHERLLCVRRALRPDQPDGAR